MAQTKSKQNQAKEAKTDTQKWADTIDLPVQHTMPIEQQVHLTAGLLILIGVVFGYVCTPWFYLIPLFVGIGLISSGLTGYCTMSAILRQMPWNQ